MGVMLGTDTHAGRIRREWGMGVALTDGAGQIEGVLVISGGYDAGDGQGMLR